MTRLTADLFRAAVSQYVLLKSHCPVTIVPDEGKDEERDDNHP